MKSHEGEDRQRQEVGTASTKGGKVASKKPTADLATLSGQIIAIDLEYRENEPQFGFRTVILIRKCRAKIAWTDPNNPNIQRTQE